MNMLWGFQLELKQSLRTKKLWVILGIMMLLYIPTLYITKSSMVMSGEEITNVGDAVMVLIDNINGLGGFFISMLALLMGATAINSEIEKGTLRVAMSKPITRISYIGGKFAAHAVILLLALLLTTIVSIIGLSWLGAPITGELFKESLLFNMLLLLAMIQLVALGYIMSTYIKSSSAALGAALAIFFVVFMIMPTIVQFMLIKDYIANPEQPVNWEEIQQRQKEYTTRYLFYVPTKQIDIIVGDASKVSGDFMNPQREYLGLGYAIKKNLINLGILVGMTGLYLVLAFHRFLRMDLR